MKATIPAPFIDLNRTATNEQEAAIMAWDLYRYIRELEINAGAGK